uniref:Uncharacterized protein n=1 Tax=Arundo donax TaxID=35708 RepID=A0A0A9C673_ARUDO
MVTSARRGGGRVAGGGTRKVWMSTGHRPGCRPHRCLHRRRGRGRPVSRGRDLRLRRQRG